MNDLVFLESAKLDAEPFTTSDVIAEYAGIKHHAIRQLIRKHKKHLEDFGILAFEMPKIEGRGRPDVIYHLNEQQATFLITLLKNTPAVVAFKKELVRQFYVMRAELTRRQAEREALKPIRRSLTDAVKEAGGKPWAYKNYTDLAYKSATGQTAAQLRKTRAAPKTAKAVEYMTSDEIHAVAKRQNQIATLLELGLDYQDVKALLEGKSSPQE